MIDALRPETSRLWQALSLGERARFLAHLKMHWEIHRHRAPIETLDQIEAWRRSGGLSVRAARVVRAWDDGARLFVTLSSRGGTTETQAFDRVINCTGADLDLARSGGLLLRSLLARRLIAQDPLRLGLLTDASGAALRADGSVVKNLFVLGAARRPLLWETTAVPELSRHAAVLACEVVRATLSPPRLTRAR